MVNNADKIKHHYARRCQDISSHAISTYAISTVAISTAHNFNLLHFQPSAISTYINFG